MPSLSETRTSSDTSPKLSDQTRNLLAVASRTLMLKEKSEVEAYLQARIDAGYLNLLPLVRELRSLGLKEWAQKHGLPDPASLEEPSLVPQASQKQNLAEPPSESEKPST